MIKYAIKPSKKCGFHQHYNFDFKKKVRSG